VALISLGLVLIVWTLADPDQWAITTKRSTKAGESETEFDVALAVAVMAAGAIFVLLGALFSRISEVSLPGGTSLKLGSDWLSDAKAAAAQADKGDPLEDDEVASLLDLRLKLERKLTWMAKHFVGPDGKPLGYLTPGSLAWDHYLTPEQARTASRILATPLQPTQSRDPDWKEFIEDGDRLAGNVRAAAVFEQTYHVLKKLEEGPGHWHVDEVVWDRGRRPDLQVRRDNGPRVRLATAFPYWRIGSVKDAQKRLGELRGDDLRAVVIPRRDPERDDVTELVRNSHEVPDQIPVIYLDQLKSWLKGLNSGSDTSTGE
jgi:hypothetical protein